MSERYPGGIISKTGVTPTGPYQNGTAPGVWTLDQQAYWQKQGLWPIAGNTPPYIEDVFSTYLYTGSSGTVTNTNNIDISGKGGLVWVKNRSAGTTPHMLADTARGGQYTLNTDTISDQGNQGAYGFTFSSTGFSLPNSFPELNTSGNSYASWTFRKQPKFFDVVTYTGNGTYGRTVAHNLGAVPGFIIVKCTSNLQPWAIYHRSLGGTKYMNLNATTAAVTDNAYWNNTDPTSTEFTVGGDGDVNGSGKTYVAYLYAHNAGGFGATGTDNVISCGSYTGNGSSGAGPLVNLGYEPQWIMVKRSSSGTGPWSIFDTMRGLTIDGEATWLNANTADPDSASRRMNIDSSTGFHAWNSWADYNQSGVTYIYVAIRRGPMKTPTVGTSVFLPSIASSGSITTNFPIDSFWQTSRNGWSKQVGIVDRLRGISTTTADSYSGLSTALTDATFSTTSWSTGINFNNTGVSLTGFLSSPISYAFARAPGFMDEVCYTGTGSNTTFGHNLGVAPEMMIVKCRSAETNWAVYSAATGPTYTTPFTTQAAAVNATMWNSTAPTASVFSVGTAGGANSSGATYVAYLFATCPGVSKVGSYTGTGTTQQINCGFSAGSRFVLIKRTDGSGDWYVWDSARGIVSGTDPFLLLNTITAEDASADFVDTYSAGFEISSTAPAAINASGGTFIFLAIA